MNQFLTMGGYGAYIWPAYLVSGLTLGGLIFLIMRRAARARDKLKQLEKSRSNAPHA
jgi:heme exporter protein D